MADIAVVVSAINTVVVVAVVNMVRQYGDNDDTVHRYGDNDDTVRRYGNKSMQCRALDAVLWSM
jgi:hypothetical protein